MLGPTRPGGTGRARGPNRLVGGFSLIDLSRRWRRYSKRLERYSGIYVDFPVLLWKNQTRTGKLLGPTRPGGTGRARGPTRLVAAVSPIDSSRRWRRYSKRLERYSGIYVDFPVLLWKNQTRTGKLLGPTRPVGTGRARGPNRLVAAVSPIDSSPRLRRSDQRLRREKRWKYRSKRGFLVLYQPSLS